MIKCFGSQNGQLRNMQIGGLCPHCATVSRFTLAVNFDPKLFVEIRPGYIVATYYCDACSGVVPVEWTSPEWSGNGGPYVHSPRHVLHVVPEFDYQHVPEAIVKDISEALKCYSVQAYNGFAATVRRAVQTICGNLGASGSSKVQNQIEDAFQQGMLDEGQAELAKTIMLTGHDGAHPHLPDVDEERASVLIELLRDLCYQLFTRPGKIKESTLLRSQAIDRGKA